METQAYFEDIQHYILKELRRARTKISDTEIKKFKSEHPDVEVEF